MTRKDYNALAASIHAKRKHYEGIKPKARVSKEIKAAIQGACLDAVDSMARDIADICEADNPHFDRDRFMIACGVPR
jgi:hypothetical protein